MSVCLDNADGSGQDFDLNIAPIIDCFTVLIAYLLVSASFISIGFFDVGVSTTSDVSTPSQVQDPQEFMSVQLESGNRTQITMRGPETSTVMVPERSGARDYDGLLAQIRGEKAKWPKLTDVSITADSEVKYDEIISAVESLKKELPKVFVGE